MNEAYPAIKERAEQESAEINWGDKTGLEADSYAAKGFAPDGQTPVVHLSGSPSHTRINMISSLTNQGKVRFMLYEEKMDSAVFIKFLKRLISDAPKKVFLIVDKQH